MELVARVASDQLRRDWKRWFQIDIHKELQHYPEILLYHCHDTDLRFFCPSDIAGSSRLYEQLQRYDWYYMSDKWEYRAALKDIAPGSEIAEVGCGSGAFLKLASLHGLNALGLEINEAAAQAAVVEGVPVEIGDLHELAPLTQARFDAVCSFQVLEHVNNPREFLVSCLKMLKKGGKLILSVPNSESYLRYQYNLLDMPPHHMTRWSATVFKRLEHILPVRVLKIRREPLAPYHVPEYVNAYATRFRSGTSYGRLVFNRFSLPAARWLLGHGVRSLLTGHTLYAVLMKL